MCAYTSKIIRSSTRDVFRITIYVIFEEDLKCLFTTALYVKSGMQKMYSDIKQWQSRNRNIEQRDGKIIKKYIR